MRFLAAAAFILFLPAAAFAQDQAPDAPEAAAPPAAPAANPPMTGPQLLIQTSMGDITLQLDQVHAPQSVAHILRLARARFYDGSAIYRVQKDFVIQMGSYTADGKGRGVTYKPVPLEANNGLKNLKFTVALPHGDDPNSAGPDFFINMQDNPNLDQKPDDPRSGFAVFGEVTEASRAVAQAINDTPVGGGYGPFGDMAPKQPVVIQHITVVGDPPPPTNPAMTGPRLLIQTSMGDITLQLDQVRAPASVANILRYTRDHHYDGTIIYRVVKGFLVQMGSWDANGKGRGVVLKPVPLEANNGLKNYRGAVALPREEKNPTSAGPDFFIDLNDNPMLDRKPDDNANRTGFAVFGQVVAGMDVLDKIAEVPVGGGKGPMPDADPVTAITIRRVSVIGDPAPKPAAAKPAAPAKKP